MPGGRRRAVIAATALALLVSACASGETRTTKAGDRPAGYGLGLGEGKKKSNNAKKKAPAKKKAAPKADPAPAPIPPQEREVRTEPKPPPAQYWDLGPVGQMARDFLGSSKATRLVVEVDYIAGNAPSGAALRHLEDILEREADKPGGVQVLRGNAMPAGPDKRHRFEEIDAMEKKHRDHWSEGSKATMWVAYLDGQLDTDDGSGVLGVAYRASGAAVFPERIQRAATAGVTGAAIERAVLVHEVGHLLGLIELSYESQHDRQDPRSPGHSTEDDSVMYAAVNDLALSALIAGGPPDDFNAADRDDMRRLRNGTA